MTLKRNCLDNFSGYVNNYKKLFNFFFIFIYFSCLTCVYSTNQPIQIECSTNLRSFQKHYGIDKHIFLVQCSCQTSQIKSCYVVGTNEYAPSSSICCAGIHNGKISLTSNKTRMMLHIVHKKRKNFESSYRNGIRARSFSQYMPRYFIVSEPEDSVEKTKPLLTTLQLTSMSTTTLQTISQSATNDPLGNTSTDFQTQVLPLSIEKEMPKSLDHLAKSETVVKTMSTSKAITSSIKFTIQSSSFSSPLSDYTKDTLEIRNSELLAFINTTAIPLIVVLSCALVLVIVISVAYHCRRLNCRWIIQATHCNNSEPCVCYVAKDLSSQGLLNDPETCDRPCSVRLSKSSPDDDDCYQCKSKYDF